MTTDTTHALWLLFVCAVLYAARVVITREWRL